MHRRRLLALSAAAVVLPATTYASYTAQSFSPGLWDQVQEWDFPAILNFRASWSLTCQIKADLIADLRNENPIYAGLSIIDVDWDTFGPSRMAQGLRVERRSTLLVVKRGEEIARLVNEPYKRRVKALFDTALAA